VVVESWATKEGLEKAEEIGVRGVILGSLPSSLVGFASSPSFPVMIMEGFGEVPISRPLFSLLQQHAGREACMVSAPYGVRLLRPQVIIPFLRGEEPPRGEGPALKEGALVRLVREPYLGKVGYVANLPPQKRRVEWGVEVEGVEVDLEEKGRVFVPLANFELLEGSSL